MHRIYPVTEGGEPVNNGFWYHYEEDMTTLMHESFRGMINEGNPDSCINIETNRFNVLLECSSCEYDMDLGEEVWLNASRWTRLTREYMCASKIQTFIDGACDILSGEARSGASVSMLFLDPVRTAKKHRWGGCLQSAVFRGDLDNSPTITFYSRTSYLGYMGLLDAGIAHCLVRDICSQFENVDPSDIGFAWHLTSAQAPHFKILPFIYSQPDLMEYLEDGPQDADTESWRHIRNWYSKVIEAYEKHGDDIEAMMADEKYGPLKRIKRRWYEHKGLSDRNLPPSCPISTLDFSKCYDHAEDNQLEYDGASDDDDD